MQLDSTVSLAMVKQPSLPEDFIYFSDAPAALAKFIARNCKFKMCFSRLHHHGFASFLHAKKKTNPAAGCV